ncbi:hypothetical protein [Actinomyces sp. HMSC065F12]|uniref:hypothetical protein n=1 Tax=Actinomyces sp. HMSC065F12 TaxID=1739479 RepID=UPI000A792788|nr:hypothetical protein [Actinomyces sp. HMSC065F12]
MSKTMTRQATRAISELSEIAQWLPLLTTRSTIVYGVRSARVMPARCARHDGLPFGLDHRIDQTDDGWPGIRTHVGALEILASYARAIASERGTYTTTSPIADLQRDIPWAAEHYEDVDAVLDEIHRIHYHIARLTGHAPTLVGTCECGGRIYRYPTRRGLTDQSWCNTCDRLYLTQGEAVRTRLQHVTSLDVYVTRQDLKTIWPTLTDNQIDLWVHRGIVEPRDGRPKVYPLAVVNTRMNTTRDHDCLIK